MYGVNLVTEPTGSPSMAYRNWYTYWLTETIAFPRAEATRGQISERLNFTGFPHASTATTNSCPVDPRCTTHKYSARPLPSKSSNATELTIY